MNKYLLGICLLLSCVASAHGFIVDDLIRDYDGECSFMESGLFTTTDIQWHSVEHSGYVMTIARGSGDDGIVIKNFIPGEADLHATFNPANGRLTIPVQEWPFSGYEFCHGSSDLQYSDDTPVVVRVAFDASCEIIIEFPTESWGVRDAQYGDYMSVIRAKARFCGREKTSDGIGDMISDSENTGRYYNLQGIEVKNPDKGIYIYISSGTTRKVMLK